MSEPNVVATVLSVSALLFLASVIYIANRWMRMPFAVTLVLVGLALGELIRRHPAFAALGSLQLSADVLTFIFMPTLVFQAAFATDTRLLLKNVLPVTVLAVPAVLISSIAAGFGLHWAIGIPLGAAMVFGAIVSSADSTAVLSLFRNVGAPKRLTILVDGENLLNDATSIVAFRVILGILGVAGGATLMNGGGLASAALLSFTVNFAGGLLVGATLGYLFGKLIEYIEDDDLIEILLTTVLAYLTFLFAERVVGVSGVMAVVGAGLVLSGWGLTKYSPPTLQYLERFWDYLAFIASSLVFLMVGLSTDLGSLAGVLRPIGWAVLVAIAARALSIYGLFPVVNRLPGIERTDARYQTALVWGGLRGAITLVLAMSLPAEFAYRELLLQLAFGVVFFSLIVQGLTLEPLMRLLRIDAATLPEVYMRDGSLLRAKLRARERLAELRDAGMFDQSVVSQLEQNYAAEETRIKTQIDSLRDAHLHTKEELKILKREYLLVEKRAYLDLFNRGQLSEKGLKDLQHSIELQIDFIRTGGLLPAWTIHSPIRWKVEAVLFRVLDALVPYSRIVQRWRLNRIADRYEEHWGRLVATGQVLNEIKRLEQQDSIAPELLDEMRILYTRWHENARQRSRSIGEQFPEYATKVQQLMAARLGLQAEAEAINDYERLEILPEREAKALRDEVNHKLRRLRKKPLEELAPRPRELLAKVPFFRGLPAEEFDRIVELLRTRTFLADETIIREGDVGDSLFLIGRGVVRVTMGGGGVPSVTMATLVAGDFFGEVAVITGNPRNATVTAVTYCALYELRRADLEAVQIVCPTIQQVLEAAALERSGAVPA